MVFEPIERKKFKHGSPVEGMSTGDWEGFEKRRKKQSEKWQGGGEFTSTPKKKGILAKFIKILNSKPKPVI